MRAAIYLMSAPLMLPPSRRCAPADYAFMPPRFIDMLICRYYAMFYAARFMMPADVAAHAMARMMLFRFAAVVLRYGAAMIDIRHAAAPFKTRFHPWSLITTLRYFAD